MHLQKIVEGLAKTFKDEAIMSGGKAESIEHVGAEVFILTGLFAVDAFANIGFDEGAFVVASDVAYNLDGDGVILTRMLIVKVPLVIVTTMMSIAIAGGRSFAILSS